jgi:hypothetical protein
MFCIGVLFEFQSRPERSRSNDWTKYYQNHNYIVDQTAKLFSNAMNLKLFTIFFLSPPGLSLKRTGIQTQHFHV